MINFHCCKMPRSFQTIQQPQRWDGGRNKGWVECLGHEDEEGQQDTRCGQVTAPQAFVIFMLGVESRRHLPKLYRAGPAQRTLCFIYMLYTQLYGKVTGHRPGRPGLRSLNSFSRPTPFSVIPSSMALRTGGALGPWREDTKGSDATQYWLGPQRPANARHKHGRGRVEDFRILLSRRGKSENPHFTEE
jgi:hypothetical protein